MQWCQSLDILMTFVIGKLGEYTLNWPEYNRKPFNYHLLVTTVIKISCESDIEIKKKLLTYLYLKVQQAKTLSFLNYLKQ